MITSRSQEANPSQHPKCISIGSSVSVGLTVVFNRHKQRPRNVGNNRLHRCTLSMRYSVIMPKCKKTVNMVQIRIHIISHKTQLNSFHEQHMPSRTKHYLIIKSSQVALINKGDNRTFNTNNEEKNTIP